MKREGNEATRESSRGLMDKFINNNQSINKSFIESPLDYSEKTVTQLVPGTFGRPRKNKVLKNPDKKYTESS